MWFLFAEDSRGFVFFKQKMVYEVRSSDWKSDVCSSALDLAELVDDDGRLLHRRMRQQVAQQRRLAAAEEAGQHGDGERPFRNGERRLSAHGRARRSIGRASCSASVCQSVLSAVSAVAFNHKTSKFSLSHITYSHI